MWRLVPLLAVLGHQFLASLLGLAECYLLRNDQIDYNLHSRIHAGPTSSKIGGWSLLLAFYYAPCS